MILMTEMNLKKFRESKAIRSMVANSSDYLLDYSLFLDFLSPAINEIFGYSDIDFNTYVCYKNKIKESLKSQFGITLIR